MKGKIFILTLLMAVSLSGISQHKKTTFPLVTAAAKGDLGKVKAYIKKGENINQKNRARWTALAYAVKFNHLDVVQFLIDKGADINLTVNTGETPLQIALKNNNYKIAKYLVSKGADVNKPDIMKMSPLMWAVKEGNMDKVKFLIENGADINQHNISGRTALDMCTDYKVKKYLISQGAKTSEELL